jgi:sulfate transport system permease protein
LGTTTLDERIQRPAVPGAGARLSAVARGVLARWGLRTVAIVYLGVMVAIPTAAVVSRGFADGLGALRDALAQPGAHQALILTIGLAILTALVNAVMGTVVAYVLVRYRFPGRRALSTLVDIPFAIPTLVTGVMLVALYGPNSLLGGFFGHHGVQIIFAKPGILLALLFVTLPLVVRTVQPVLQQLDEAEEEAARVLGAGRWTTFRKVVLPHLRSGIVAGGLLAFARAMGEFGAVVILSGNILNRTLTAPVFIYQLINQFKPEDAAAVATLLFGLSFVLVLITERLIARDRT